MVHARTGWRTQPTAKGDFAWRANEGRTDNRFMGVRYILQDLVVRLLLLHCQQLRLLPDGVCQVATSHHSYLSQCCSVFTLLAISCDRRKVRRADCTGQQLYSWHCWRIRITNLLFGHKYKKKRYFSLILNPINLVKMRFECFQPCGLWYLS